MHFPITTLLLLPTLALSQVLTSTTSTTSTSAITSSTPTFNSPARVAQEDNANVDESKKVPTLLDATGTPMETEDPTAGEKVAGGNAGGNGSGSSAAVGVRVSSLGALVLVAGVFVMM